MPLRLTAKMDKKFKIKPQTLEEPSIRQSPDNLTFDFTELRPISYSKAKRDGEFFIKFLERLKKLGNLDLKSIYASDKHSFGMEKMKADNLTSSAKQYLPAGVNSLTVFRATGDNHVFLGIRNKNIFQVMFVEYKFGDVYNHGK